MIISWEQIRQVIELFSEEHFMIKRFYSDYEDQLSTYSTLGEDFPVLYMTPVDGVMGYTQNTLNIRFYCFDRIIRDRSNWNGIVSDTHRCLNDLYKFIQSPGVELIDTELEASILPINDATMDYVAGWYIDIEVSLDTYSDCFIMVDGVPSFTWSGNFDIKKYITCETLADCDTFTEAIDNLQEQIDNIPSDNFFTTGATLSGSTLIFDRNDLPNAYSVDLSSLEFSGDYNDLTNTPTNLSDFINDENFISCDDLSGCTTIQNIEGDIINLQNDLGNYLPLTGGTLTGNLFVDSARIDFATDGNGNNGLWFQRNAGNNWTLGSNGVGNVMQIQGNLVRIPQSFEVQRAGITVNATLGTLLPTSPVFRVLDLGNTEVANITLDGTINSNKLNVNNILIVDNNNVYSNGTTGDISNTIFGNSAGINITTGFNNDLYGRLAGSTITTGINNTAFGISSGRATTGLNNVSVGALAGNNIGAGSNNTYIGRFAGRFNTGNDNIGIGEFAGTVDLSSTNVTNINNCVLVGKRASVLNNGETNSIVIGHETFSNGSNTTTIGNDDITDTYLRGELHVDIERWTIDFMEELFITIYASEDIEITEIDDIVNSPTITILVNSSSYTLGDPITTGDQIDIISDIQSVIKIKVEK
jgi:hypothetical protein